MGSKNLKAIAIRGSGQPDVAQHKRFLELLEEMRLRMRESVVVPDMRRFGTAKYLEFSSALGLMATKNYREGTFENVASISAKTAREQYWQRDFACFLCPAACKKAGVVPAGPYAGTVHDGPEYETGSMLGSNLLIPELPAVLKAIYLVDDFGIDAISAGNIIGFLMEAYEKRLIDRAFLDGIDLQWGNAEAVFQVLRRMAYREGVGNEAAQGVRHLADKIGQDSHKFAIHCKGQEFAGWNCHPEPSMALGYALSNRGACHLSGRDAKEQDDRALNDSTGICMFLQDEYGKDRTAQLLQSVTGLDWTADDYRMAGERVFTLEKCFNLREGFCRDDDTIPDRFFEEPYTTGPKKDAVLDRSKFEQLKTAYYDERGWDPETTRPGRAKLESLGLAFADST